MKPRVLVACEFTGTVRDAFTKQGCDAWSCDIIDTEVPGNHFPCDVFTVINSDWDLLIAHPPCRYLSNSGVKHLYQEGKLYKGIPNQEDPERQKNMQAGAEFFKRLLNANVPRVCIENPIQHGYATAIIGVEYTQKIQPWEFGHEETKATCLWLKNLPKLIPTNIKRVREAKIHQMAPSPNRSRERSRTYQGIANAMATQWAPLLFQK